MKKKLEATAREQEEAKIRFETKMKGLENQEHVNEEEEDIFAVQDDLEADDEKSEVSEIERFLDDENSKNEIVQTGQDPGAPSCTKEVLEKLYSIRTRSVIGDTLPDFQTIIQACESTVAADLVDLSALKEVYNSLEIDNEDILSELLELYENILDDLIARTKPTEEIALKALKNTALKIKNEQFDLYVRYLNHYFNREPRHFFRFTTVYKSKDKYLRESFSKILEICHEDADYEQVKIVIEMAKSYRMKKAKYYGKESCASFDKDLVAVLALLKLYSMSDPEIIDDDIYTVLKSYHFNFGEKIDEFREVLAKTGSNWKKFRALLAYANCKNDHPAHIEPLKLFLKEPKLGPALQQIYSDGVENRFSVKHIFRTC